MSQLANQISAAFAQVHTFAGDPFTMGGKNYVGVFGTADAVSPMTAAGFEEGVSLSCVVRIAQFATLPKVRDRLRYSNRDYSIVGIQNDRQGANLVLALKEL